MCEDEYLFRERQLFNPEASRWKCDFVNECNLRCLAKHSPAPDSNMEKGRVSWHVSRTYALLLRCMCSAAEFSVHFHFGAYVTGQSMHTACVRRASQSPLENQ